MIQKITLTFTKIFLLFSILFFAESNLYGQPPTIVPQSLSFPRICAGLIVNGAPFNEYNATFSYVNFPAGTTFEVQLSDELGSFTTPVSTTKISFVDNPALQQQTIKFAVPTNLKGSDTHSIRIISSLATASPSSKFRNSLNVTEFPVYYRTYVESFTINDKSLTASFCSGGSMSLSVDNSTPTSPSPRDFSNLKYKWFKDDVVIAGQSGITLTVNAAGVYYAQIDYGGCLDENFSSNRVTVTSSNSGAAGTISSSLGNPFCSNGTGTVLTATSGNSYVWKKDGVVINGVTTRSYTTNESGLYTVDIDFGGCKATGSINLSSNGFNASIDVDVENPITIEEGETINVSVTTDATTPTFEWYLNDNLISGATTDTYVVAVRGRYRVKISQASGCIATKEFNFRVTGKGTSTVIPNIVNLSGLSPYWTIPVGYSSKVMIISSNGEMVLDVVDYQGDWPDTKIDFKNVNPVYYYVVKGTDGEKKGSITVIR
ncbi:gliding motility protein SprC [Flavobacterium sp. ANB]|uniref:gliding motility protein SprC n=1 Tax=unclassified Flavobacterium TaxID=196869 RepID=UPI0012B6FBD5|nr:MULTISPECIES: gliding motility protein SprC [unclassified Flavobacterium]MBF4515355.1 gliding motility protein SprC [Flavobacterium sp. ANB]MTD70267.1 gliding motility protein SprC [Flavobacterium sp. LC2016-13]